MDVLKFWEIVQHVHAQSSGDMDEKCELIKAALSTLPKDEATAFAYCFDSMMDQAYSHSLWGAAYVINGGCGDDTFSPIFVPLLFLGAAARLSAHFWIPNRWPLKITMKRRGFTKAINTR